MELVEFLMQSLTHMMWPIVIIMLILYFGAPLRDLLRSLREILINRGLKVTASGVEIPSPQEEVETLQDVLKKNPRHKDFLKQNKPELLDQPLTEQQEVKEPSFEPLEKTFIEDIKSSLEKFLSEKDPEVTDKELLENLICEAYISLYFERSFQRLLGSQLELLTHLMHQPSFSTPLENAQSIFEAALANVPGSSFDKWIHYLEQLKLVKKAKETIELTEEGQGFIRYLLDRGYSLKKAG